jgi:hypothetical protein
MEKTIINGALPGAVLETRKDKPGQIKVINSANILTAVRFNNLGMRFEKVYLDTEINRGNFPFTTTDNVLDALRSKKPVKVFFSKI